MSQVNLTDVQTDLAYLLGETSAPSSSNPDYTVRSTFIQRSLERIYRIYDFGLTKLTATVALTQGSGTLPTDIRPEGSSLDVRVINSGVQDDNIFELIDYSDYDDYQEGDYRYWTRTGSAGESYIYTTEPNVAAVTVEYATKNPTINATIATPFPSSMVIALGALVPFRSSEDPEADIAQDEANFQNQLSEVVRAERRSRHRKAAQTLHDYHGTHTGDVSGYYD